MLRLYPAGGATEGIHHHLTRNKLQRVPWDHLAGKEYLGIRKKKQLYQIISTITIVQNKTHAPVKSFNTNGNHNIKHKPIINYDY